MMKDARPDLFYRLHHSVVSKQKYSQTNIDSSTVAMLVVAMVLAISASVHHNIKHTFQLRQEGLNPQCCP